MKNLTLLICCLCLFLFLSACKNSVVGTYENTYEKGAVQEIIIKSDSTYQYIYKTVVYSDSITGKWNCSDDGSKLYLSNWKGLGKYTKQVNPDIGEYVIPISSNTLIFNPDLGNEVNFTKK